jgi:hypothetical protein
MSLKRIIVPKKLIQKHCPHPEFYGESLVILENNMVTDVYTNDEGELITETNNDQLIDYLEKTKCEQRSAEIIHNEICMHSIKLSHLSKLKTWFEMGAFKKFGLVRGDDDMIRQYISHAQTLNSDVFMTTIQTKETALTAYTIIDGVALMHTEVYDARNLSSHHLDQIIHMIQQHVLSHYSLQQLIFSVYEFEEAMIEALERSNFKKVDTNPIRIQTLTGYLLQIQYELKI